MSLGYIVTDCPVCPANCADNTVILPVQSSPCFTAWDRRKSEGRYLFIFPCDTNTSHPLLADGVDLTTLQENPDILFDLIDNDRTDASKGVCLCVTFDLTYEDTTETYKGEEYTTDRTWSLNSDTIDSNDKNYAFTRSLMSCPLKAYIAFQNDGCSFFVVKQPVTIKGGFVSDRGTESYETLQFFSTWKQLCPPARFNGIDENLFLTQKSST